MKNFLVEIKNKSNIFDSSGESIKHSIIDLGIKNVQQVKTSQLYILRGILTKGEIEKVAKQLLTDLIIQEYKIYTESFKIVNRSEFIVDVFYKSGVTDTVSQTVLKAVKDMGIKTLKEVHTGFRYYIKGKFSKEIIEKICKNLLANSVIQTYTIV